MRLRHHRIPQVVAIIFLSIVAVSGAVAAPCGIVPELAGHLEDRKITEASGLARSRQHANVLWVINDNGAKEIVHAIDPTGKRLGEFDLKGSRNKDWEDLASFVLDESPYLMVADIGDNEAKRPHRRLYFVKEPAPQKHGKASIAWQVKYTYPDGPRDAEAAAVDSEHGRTIILSKRDLPPRLYDVPLRTAADSTHVATFLGEIESLHKPSVAEREAAPILKDWFWQPVGMDLSDDGLAAVILTYRAVYYYVREPGEAWIDALNSQPVTISIGEFENAESITFADSARTVLVTGENRNSPLLCINFNGVVTP